MANSHAATADKMGGYAAAKSGARSGYYARKGRGFRPWDLLDIRWWKPSEEKREATRSHFLGTLFVLVLVIVGVYVVYHFLSPAGQRQLTEAKLFVHEYNPASWYKGKLLEAQSIGDVWGTNDVAEEKKGVLFEGFSSRTGAQVPQGVPVTFAYDIKLSNTEVSNLKLAMGCKVKGKDIEGDINENPMIVSGRRMTKYARCTLPAEVTQGLSGTVEVEGSVSFPFKTEDVRIKVYFTGEETEMGLPEGEDFFEYMGIDESQPILAEYHGEPVEIGLGVSVNNQQPVVLSEGFNPLVGISLSNQWSGKMSKLASMKLELPKEVTINQEISKSPSRLCPFVLSRQGTDKNEYRADESFIQDIKLSTGDEKSTAFECYLDVSPELLGTSEYAVKEYKAEAEYEYELEPKTAVITVKSATGEEEGVASLI